MIAQYLLAPLTMIVYAQIDAGLMMYQMLGCAAIWVQSCIA